MAILDDDKPVRMSRMEQEAAFRFGTFEAMNLALGAMLADDYAEITRMDAAEAQRETESDLRIAEGDR